MAELAGATQPVDGLLAVSLHPEQLDGAPDPLPIPTNSQSLPILLSIFLKQTQAAQPRVTHVKDEGTSGRKRVNLYIFHFAREFWYSTRQPIYLFLDRQLIGYFSSSVCYA